ncbi:BTAD domain-containing putative transcriptional regulator [Saccharothrix sp. NPDC042600]|uniref:AfsR/SARP family transcriptional regulator n=1 Tax=Saccharothrix TaxID=2071 RepID=UPI0033C9DCB4|nr:BTAD domain-containing putative transcriptional regulator [Saccharothrix mutabilis subsp. capreolus]
MDFQLLGTTLVRAADGRLVEPRQQQVRTLVALLLLDRDTVVSKSQIAASLWPDEADKDQAALDNRIHQVVRTLRNLLGDSDKTIIATKDNGYLISVDREQVDLYRFRDLVKRALASTDHAARRADLLREALALWRGSPLTDSLPGAQGDGIRANYEEERLAALRERVEADLLLGRHGELVSELRDLTGAHPRDERLHGQLMLALYRCGRQADALDVYAQCNQALAELGLVPGSDLDRLRDQILARDSTLDLPEPPADEDSAAIVRALPRPQQVPVLPPLFTGRADQLAVLDAGAKVDSAAGPQIWVISGPGGMGKSWLAQHWAVQHRHLFPDGQLYIDLHGFGKQREALPPSAALREFFDAFGVQPDQMPRTDQARANRWRSLTAEKTLLVLLDNAASSEQVLPLLPAGPNCTVLITSRTHLTDVIARGARHLHLPPMNDDEARRLLVTRLGADRVSAQPEAVQALLSACSGYPLALGVLAGRAQYNAEVPLAALVDEMELTELDIFDTDNPDGSLSAVLASSLSALDEDLVRAFTLLTLSPSPDFDGTAAAALLAQSPPRTRALLKGLVQVSLLEQTYDDRYQTHELIRSYAAQRAKQALRPEELEAARHRILAFFLHSAVAADHLLSRTRQSIDLEPPPPGCIPLEFATEEAAMRWLNRNHRNLLAAQQLAADLEYHREAWQFAWAMHTFHARRGHRRDHLVTWELGQAAADALGEPAVVALVSRLHSGARTRMGDVDGALALLHRALDSTTATADRNGQILTHQFLAWHWQERRTYDQALEHASRMLELLEMPGQGDRARTAEAHNIVGWCAAQLGNYGEGVRHCTQALEAARMQHNGPLEAASLDSLGYIALHTGQTEQAVTHLTAALELLRAQENATAVADTLDRLGTGYAKLGDHQSARRAWTEAHDLYRQQQRTDDAVRVRSVLEHPPQT